MRLLRPTPRRAWRAARAALVLATATIVGACVDFGGPDGDDDAYSIALDLWQQSKPSAYQYTIQRKCLDCPTDRASRVVTVTVRSGAVTDRVYTGTTEAVPASEATYYPTIDGLFVELRQLLDAGPDRNRVVFNGQRGYPFSVSIDPTGAANDETGWEITSFTDQSSS